MALTWDALIMTYSHSGFKWKIIDLMLTLNGIGIKSKNEDKQKQNFIQKRGKTCKEKACDCDSVSYSWRP